MCMSSAVQAYLCGGMISNLSIIVLLMVCYVICVCTVLVVDSFCKFEEMLMKRNWQICSYLPYYLVKST